MMNRRLILGALLLVSCAENSGAVDRIAQPVLSYPGFGVVDYTQSFDGSGHYDPSGAALGTPGHVMTGALKLYPIFYGDWHTTAALNLETLLRAFMNGLSGSQLYGMLTSYDDGLGHAVQSQFNVAESTTVATLQTNGMNDLTIDGPNIDRIIQQMTGGQGDSNGVYIIVPDSRFSGTNFCQICGYHPRAKPCATGPATGKCAPVQTLVLVNAGFCMSQPMVKTGCLYDRGAAIQNPNADLDPSAIGDAMVTFLWHELAEAVTDQFGDGYRVVDKSSGVDDTKENADQCQSPGMVQDSPSAFPVGAVQLDLSYQPSSTSSALANTHLGARDYLLQGNWLHADRGGCVRRLALNHPTVSATAVTGDFDGNGISDLLFHSSNGFELNLVGSGGNAGAKQAFPPPSQIYAVANFDTGPTSDLLLRDLISGDISIWLVSSNNITGTIPVAYGMDRSEVIKAVGDFDGDGLADILFQNMQTNAAHVWLNGNPTTQPFNVSDLYTVTPAPGPGDTFESLATANFGANGVAQVLWEDPTTSPPTFKLWIFGAFDNAGKTVHVVSPTITPSINGFLGAADVDRDGVVDLLGVQNSGAIPQLTWCKMTGGLASTCHAIANMPPPQYRFSGGGTSVKAAGSAPQTEILWRNRQSGGLVRWLLSASGAVTDNSPVGVSYTPDSDLVAN